MKITRSPVWVSENSFYRDITRIPLPRTIGGDGDLSSTITVAATLPGAEMRGGCPLVDPLDLHAAILFLLHHWSIKWFIIGIPKDERKTQHKLFLHLHNMLRYRNISIGFFSLDIYHNPLRYYFIIY